MRNSIIFQFLFFIYAWHHAVCTTELAPNRELIEECCDRGRAMVTNTASLSGWNMTEMWDLEAVCQLSEHIEYPEQRGCSYVQQACCLSQLRLTACRLGAQLFATMKNQSNSDVCDIIPRGSSISDTVKECCLCCLIDSWDILAHYDAMCPLAKHLCQNGAAKYLSNESESTLSTLLESSTSSPHFENFFTTEHHRFLSTNSPSPNTDPNLNSNTDIAFPGITPASTITPIACLENYEWNAGKKVCEKVLNACPVGYVMNKGRSTCLVSDKPVKACSRGFQLDAITLDCVDIDECKENSSLCIETGQVCMNKEGGFVCRCRAGFLMELDGSCIDIDECEIYRNSPCSWGQKCSNTIGSYICIRDVPCGFGYTLDPKTQECIDIDECKIDPDICGPGMLCINVRGGHQCKDKACPKGMKRSSRGVCVFCSQGYQYDKEHKKCNDINECADTNRTEPICRSYESCVNQPGSYSCKPKIICRRGTKINSNGTNCTDIDECNEKLFFCNDEEICVNVHGTYYCAKSPCEANQKYNYVTKTCSCLKGYRQIDNKTCADIDECEEQGSDSLCGVAFQCVNYQGSYHCFVKSACPSGMHRTSPYTNCVDIDECKTGASKCNPNERCQNVIGSYKCNCRSGFRKVDDMCEDIDECSLFRPDESCPDVNARCMNIPGSYECACPSGFKWTGYPKKKCEDINECEKSPDICGDEHSCVNTIGDYFCQCKEGFRPDQKRKSCLDIDECIPLDNAAKPCPNGICVNIPGSFVCRCPRGYQIGRNNICEDINECNTSSTICATSHVNLPSSKCINLQGRHKCVMNMCPMSYTKKIFPNGYECILDDAHSCSSSEPQCLKSRPYRIVHKFVEINGKQKVPQPIAMFDMDHLPMGINRLTLDPKYAIDLDTKKSIQFLKHTFRIVKSRKSGNAVEILLRRVITAPAELMVELRASVFWRNSYLGHSIARIYIYVTNYPEEYSN